MKNALKPNGIICSQAGTVWSNIDIVKSTLQNTCNVFPVFDYGVCSVPTYPDGQIGFVLGSLNLVSFFYLINKLFSVLILNRYYMIECFTGNKFQGTHSHIQRR